MSAPPYTTALGLSASITRAVIWREVLEFVRLPLPLLRVRRGRFFDRNIWPDSCVFRIQRQPFLKPGLAISLDSIDGAFRFAYATVDAFVRMDDEHVLALVEAVHGAHLDAVHGFAANAAIVDDVGQLGVLPADCRGQLIRHVRHRGARSLPENRRREDPRPLPHSQLQWAALGAGRGVSRFALSHRACPRRAPELRTDRVQALSYLCLSVAD